MSLSVDDLVSSLSSSHIGQEAIELAALQEFLRQTGFGKPSAPATAGLTSPASSSSTPLGRRTSYAQLCTTPIAQTPLMSPAGWLDSAHFGASGGGGGSLSGGGGGGGRGRIGGVYAGTCDDEDEAMVEDLLIPSSPSTSHSRSRSASQSVSGYSQSHSHSHAHARPIHHHHIQSTKNTAISASCINTSAVHQEPSSSSGSGSMFTSCDPFYLAQVQTWGSSSMISHSHFYSQQQQQQQQTYPQQQLNTSFYSASPSPSPSQHHHHQPYPQQQQHQQPPPLIIDTHCMMAEPCSAFIN